MNRRLVLSANLGAAPLFAAWRALKDIADRYGAATASLVAMQLEYPMQREA